MGHLRIPCHHCLPVHRKGQWSPSGRERVAGCKPVQLIQVGAEYYVRDGHHRVSVTRALGQDTIEAEVTVWNAA
jgi:hypothetical protein